MKMWNGYLKSRRKFERGGRQASKRKEERPRKENSFMPCSRYVNFNFGEAAGVRGGKGGEGRAGQPARKERTKERKMVIFLRREGKRERTKIEKRREEDQRAEERKKERKKKEREKGIPMDGLGFRVYSTLPTSR